MKLFIILLFVLLKTTSAFSSVRKACGVPNVVGVSDKYTSVTFERSEEDYRVSGINQATLLISAKMNRVEVCIDGARPFLADKEKPIFTQVYTN